MDDLERLQEEVSKNKADLDRALAIITTLTYRVDRLTRIVGRVAEALPERFIELAKEESHGE